LFGKNKYYREKWFLHGILKYGGKKLSRKTVFLACLLIIIHICTPFQVFAEVKGKAILVFMDRISWHDIRDANTPALDALMEIGGIGLMTTNTGGSLSQVNAYTTLGAGARAVGASNSEMAFKYGEKFEGGTTEEIYKQRTGNIMEPGSIANLSIAQIYRNNATKQYPVPIGALGTALREAGLKVAVIGNCDTPKMEASGYENKRYLVSMMMDNRGIVPMGEIGEDILVHDKASPWGVKTNYEKMEEIFERMWQQADVIAVQLGDTSRVEDFKYHVMDHMLNLYRRNAVEDGDAMIAKIMKYFRKDKDLIMILTPLSPARELSRNNRLTPIIVAGRGFERGVLSSGSTHRLRVVTNLDVGATILKFFGIRNMPGQGGTPVFSIASQDRVDDIINFNEKLVEIFNQRGFLLRSYVTLLIIVLLMSLGQLILNRKHLWLGETLLMFIMSVPLAFLLLPIVHQPTTLRSTLVTLIIASACTALVCWAFSNTRDRIIAISCMTAIALIVDQWTGMSLIQGSPLGYDVISAARFYGIGNEYMGIMIGAACTGGAGIMERKKAHRLLKLDILVITGWAVALFTLISPNIGANVGGTIAGFFAFGITVLLIRGYKVKMWHLGALAAGLVILLIGVFMLDYARMVDSQTHMGQTVALIKQNGIEEIFNIFERKISMNIRLFRYTIWTRVFLISLAAIVILFYRPVGIFMDTVNNHPILFKGLIGATVGSIAALIANDSGIVAAATAMIFVAPPFILLIIEEVEQKVARGELNFGKKSQIPNN